MVVLDDASLDALRTPTVSEGGHVPPAEPLEPIEKILRTDERCFASIPKKIFPYEPNYINTEVHGNVRIHYLDEGKKSSKETILCMHGEPSWCFLYRKMIPGLVQAGYRVVCPDLPGFGKSDKPSKQTDYSYERMVNWMSEFVVKMRLGNVTLFAQDWGGLIGLRVAARLPERFVRICISNTGLPVGTGGTKSFMNWAYKTSQKFPTWGAVFKLTCRVPLSKEELAAYDAPFPSEAYKGATRVFPKMVPVTKGHASVEENKGALRRVYSRWRKPFLTLFGDRDPITRDGEKGWQRLVPGAKGQKHVKIKGGGHFIQEDRPQELVKHIIAFVNDNPLPAKLRARL